MQVKQNELSATGGKCMFDELDLSALSNDNADTLVAYLVQNYSGYIQGVIKYNANRIIFNGYIYPQKNNAIFELVYVNLDMKIVRKDGDTYLVRTVQYTS